MNLIEHSLKYLRESLSNYLDDQSSKGIYMKLGSQNYSDEKALKLNDGYK